MFYFLKSRERTDSKNTKVAKTNEGKLMVLLKCDVYDSKRLRFTKEQEASELLNSLQLKTHLHEIPYVDPTLFERYKMHEIVNIFLLVGG